MSSTFEYYAFLDKDFPRVNLLRARFKPLDSHLQKSLLESNGIIYSASFTLPSERFDNEKIPQPSNPQL